MERLTRRVGYGFVVLIASAMMTFIVACSGGAGSNGGGAGADPNVAVSSASWSGKGDGSAHEGGSAKLNGGDYRLTFQGHVATCQYDVEFYAWDNTTDHHFHLHDGSVSDPRSISGISTTKVSMIGADTVLDLEPNLSPNAYQLKVGDSGSFDSPCPWDASIGQ